VNDIAADTRFRSCSHQERRRPQALLTHGNVLASVRRSSRAHSLPALGKAGASDQDSAYAAFEPRFRQTMGAWVPPIFAGECTLKSGWWRRGW